MKIRRFNESKDSLESKVKYLDESLEDFCDSTTLEESYFNANFKLIEVISEYADLPSETYYSGYSITLDLDILKNREKEEYFNVEDMLSMVGDFNSIVQFTKNVSDDLDNTYVGFSIKNSNFYIDIIDLKSKVEK